MNPKTIRFTILTLCLLLFTCASPLHASPAPAGKITGHTPLVNDANTVYTVIALPASYKSCEGCMVLDKAFQTDSELAVLHTQTRFKRLVAGTKEFDYVSPDTNTGWSKLLPEVAQGKTVVVMLRGSGPNVQILHKLTSPSVEDVKKEFLTREYSRECFGILEKLKQKRPCPNCPKVDPAPEQTTEPEAPPVVTAPAIPDTVKKDEPKKDEADNQQVILGLGIAAVGTWLFMFKRVKLG